MSAEGKGMRFLKAARHIIGVVDGLRNGLYRLVRSGLPVYGMVVNVQGCEREEYFEKSWGEQSRSCVVAGSCVNGWEEYSSQ